MSTTTRTEGPLAVAKDMSPYLEPGVCVDSDHPGVIALARAEAGEGSDIERAVRLYYAIRDRFIYDPYGVEISEYGMKASTVIARNAGFCITKAALLAAACRVIGVPARLGFADVRNHLATKKLLDQLGTDLFVFHGYAELFLEGRWVKATPAFNLSLCEKFGVLPLEFDGREDSVFHPFDRAGNKHMEYVRDRGVYTDVPVQEILESFVSTYPGMYGDHAGDASVDAFEREAEAESTGS